MSFYFIDHKERHPCALPVHCRTFCFDGSDGSEPKRKIAFSHHNHEALELLWITEGELSVLVEDRHYRLSTGEVLLVNPFHLHYGEWISNKTKNSYVCFSIDLSKWMSFKASLLFETLQPLLSEETCFDEYYPAQQNGALTQVLREINRLFQLREETHECLLAAETYRMFALLYDGHYHKTDLPHKVKRDVSFMQNVSRYLKQHFADNISTADAAAALFMTVPQFCRTFKRHFGASFLNYLCLYRITRATELYRDQNMPLSDIAAAVGFLDYCYFSRSFKKHIGQSPAQYFGRRK